ncbi:MAG: inositol monophosphatase family protein, partial [Rhodothermales bacterium]
LIVEGEVAVAALGCPGLRSSADEDGSRGGIYAAIRGEGSFLIPLEGEGERIPIHVSREADPCRARFCESVESAHSSHRDAASVAELLGIKRAPLRLDSQAKYAVVASGEAEIYLRLTGQSGYVENIWDHAAGALVIEEAGGRVTDVNGSPLDYRQGSRLERNVGIVATNGHVHNDVLAALDRVLVSE